MPKNFRFDYFSGNVPSFARHLSHLRDKECRILEIGSHEGRSTTWLLENIATHPDSKIDCIDYIVQENFWSNIAAVGGLQKINFHRSTSTDALRLLPRNAFDFIFVDGNHWTPNVLEDAVMSFPLCKWEGLIGFDDYNWNDPQFNRHGCPKPAIDFFIQAYSHKVRVLEHGDLVLIKKIGDIW